MKTVTGRVGAHGAVAALAALLVVPTLAMASSGGTINFSGVIVAPQLEMSAGAGAGRASVGVSDASLERRDSAVTLTFRAPAGVVAGADVALQVNEGAVARDSVAARFVDGRGRVSVEASGGCYRVGRDGGVLSLSAKKGEGGGAAVGPRVIVVVSYD